MEAARERGVELPADLKEDLQNAPDLDLYVLYIYKAFWELDTCRPVSMAGLNPIPWTAVDAYAARYGIEDFDIFSEIVRGLDDTYRAHVNGKQQGEKSGKSKTV